MHQLFKDFLGPVATILASIVAAGVTIYFARHQKRIAEEQKHIAKRKLRYDLYTRRFEIFNAIFPFYYAMISWEGTPEQRKAKDKFFWAYQESCFLFTKDSGIEDLLKKLKEEGLKYIHLKEDKDKYKSDPNLILHQVEETKRILNEFEAGLAMLRAAMYPYLDFSQI